MGRQSCRLAGRATSDVAADACGNSCRRRERAVTDDDAAARCAPSVSISIKSSTGSTRTFGADAFALFGRGHSRPRRGRARFTRSAKKNDRALGLREALAHKDDWIGRERTAHVDLGRGVTAVASEFNRELVGGPSTERREQLSGEPPHLLVAVHVVVVAGVGEPVLGNRRA